MIGNEQNKHNLLSMKKNVKMALLMFAGALVLVGAGLLTACQPNYGKITDKALTIGNYTAIEVSNGIDVEMSAAIVAPKLEADELIHDKVVIKEEDGVLKMELVDMIYSAKIKQLKVYLPLNTDLRKISATGACYVNVKGEIRLNAVDLSGASSLDVDMTTDMKEIKMSGTSRANIVGVGDVVTLDISGGSDLEADKLLVSEMNGSLSGASSVDVTVCTRLALVASGASIINYGLVSPTCELDNDCELSGGSMISVRGENGSSDGK